jgi:hypothetical protein
LRGAIENGLLKKEMVMKIIKKLGLMALLIPALSCAPMGGIRPGKGTTFQITERDYAEIWEVVVAVVDEHLFMVAKDRALGVIKAEGKVGAITGGELIGIYITPARPGKARYIIEVTSLQQQAATPVPESYWEHQIMAEIKFKLGA